jgi:hypothetical protein
MRGVLLAVLLILGGAGLGGCAKVERFFETSCTDMGGVWSATEGCQKDIFAS